MGNAQSVPVLGETVTVVESGVKLVAAWAYAVAGKKDTADKLIEGVGNSWKEYSEKNLIIGQINVYVKKAQGKETEADRVQNKILNSFGGFVDSVPVVGHVKGVAHYIAGDNEHGDRCMFNATRSSAVIAAGALTGGLGGGAVLGGVMATGTGVAVDTTATVVTGDAKGNLEAIEEAEGSDDPNKAVDAVLGFVGDFAAGYSAAKTTKAPKARNRSATSAKTSEVKSATSCHMKKAVNYSTEIGGSQSSFSYNESFHFENKETSSHLNMY